MKADIQRHGSVSVIAPYDAVTEATIPELEQVLANATGSSSGPIGRMVLNLEEVPFVDSAGIEYLLSLAGDSTAGSLRPRLAQLTETVREALELTDSLERFYVFDSVEDAVKSYV